MRKQIFRLLLIALTAFTSISAEAQQFWNRIPILNYIKDFAQYDSKVRADGGYIYNPDVTRKVINELNRSPYSQFQVLSISSFAGQKLRTSGLYSYVTKAYDLTPRTQLYGGELVSNGGFDNGTTGWSPQISATISNDNGRLKCIDGGTGVRVTSPFTTVIGKLYTLSIDPVSITSGTMIMRITTDPLGGGTGQILQTNLTIGQRATVQFTATATTTVISVINDAVLTGKTMIFDNVSCREVLTNDLTQTTALNQPPLVRSHQMKFRISAILTGEVITLRIRW
jgi:hypothetical protein